MKVIHQPSGSEVKSSRDFRGKIDSKIETTCRTRWHDTVCSRCPSVIPSCGDMSNIQQGSSRLRLARKSTQLVVIRSGSVSGVHRCEWPDQSSYLEEVEYGTSTRLKEKINERASRCSSLLLICSLSLSLINIPSSVEEKTSLIERTHSKLLWGWKMHLFWTSDRRCVRWNIHQVSQTGSQLNDREREMHTS